MLSAASYSIYNRQCRRAYSTNPVHVATYSDRPALAEFHNDQVMGSAVQHMPTYPAEALNSVPRSLCILCLRGPTYWQLSGHKLLVRESCARPKWPGSGEAKPRLEALKWQRNLTWDIPSVSATSTSFIRFEEQSQPGSSFCRRAKASLGYAIAKSVGSGSASRFNIFGLEGSVSFHSPGHQTADLNTSQFLKCSRQFHRIPCLSGSLC